MISDRSGLGFVCLWSWQIQKKWLLHAIQHFERSKRERQTALLTGLVHTTLGIQVRNSKNDLNMKALRPGWFYHNIPGRCGVGCFWVQSSLHHNRRANYVAKAVDEIKRLKCCEQYLFLQPMLSAFIFKSFFEFRTWIPNVNSPYRKICKIGIHTCSKYVRTRKM